MRFFMIALVVCLPSVAAAQAQPKPKKKPTPTDELLQKIDALIETIDRQEYASAKEQVVALRSEVVKIGNAIRRPVRNPRNKTNPEVPALVMGVVTRQTVSQRVIVPVKINKPDLLANYDLRLLVIADGEPDVAWIQSRGALGENKGIVEMLAQLGPKKIQKKERFQISLIAWPKTLQWKQDTIPVTVAQRIFKPVGTVWVIRSPE